MVISSYKNKQKRGGVEMLIEVMEEDLVIDELKSEKKEEVIKEMALKFKEVGVVENENRFIEEIWEREKIEST
ncbi:MAG TPA: hypothetical protein EYP78_02080, partial [Candidatus Omnitrophica bacterium]|nr:hypothetical protein [Candidatus Omnitrophota bacterium]